MKVFITGISGCVGHYLFDLLANHPEYELYLIVRNRQTLKFDPAAYPQCHFIFDDMRHIEKYGDLLKQMEIVIHLAADWGGHWGNLNYSVSLFNLLDPAVCQKVIYFSTASILGQENKPLPAVEKLGTHYIRSKYQFYKKLPAFPIYPKVITLSPTWVLGGDSLHPYSHATTGIIEMRKWLWLIKFLQADVQFHYIHARDIALITKYLMEHETAEKNFVLGNKMITAQELIKEVAEFYHQRVYCQIPIPNWLINFFIFAGGRWLHSWDKYSLAKRHFVYQTTNCETFGLDNHLITLPQILKSIGL
jgi:nucleoside-diphosphate-sugar epimerase